jgi:hypothetical protein
MTNLVKFFQKNSLQPLIFGCQMRKFHHKRKTIGAAKLQIAPKKKERAKN